MENRPRMNLKDLFGKRKTPKEKSQEEQKIYALDSKIENSLDSLISTLLQEIANNPLFENLSEKQIAHIVFKSFFHFLDRMKEKEIAEKLKERREYHRSRNTPK